MSVDTRWFKDRLADREMSQRGLAKQLGLDSAAVSLMLRGRREMKLSEAADIARLLGVPAEEVLRAAGVRIDSNGTEVPIVGTVDGLGEFHWSEGLGTVKHPGGSLPPDIDAVICRSPASPLAMLDGWVLFCVAHPKGVQADAVGRLSFCRLRNGVIYLAAPRNAPGRRGRWDLMGPATDAKAVDLEWACPVLLAIP